MTDPKTDYDRLWEALARTTDLSNANTANIAALTEAMRAANERLGKVEAHPLAIRGWLQVVIAAGGCLSMAASLGLALVGVIILLVPHLH